MRPTDSNKITISAPAARPTLNLRTPHQVRQLGRTGAPCRDCSRWVSPARPPHPACGSHRTGRSTCLARWSAAGGGCRFRGPGGRDGAAAVAVADHGDAGCAGEHDPLVGEPPALVAEAPAELRHAE